MRPPIGFVAVVGGSTAIVLLAALVYAYAPRSAALPDRGAVGSQLVAARCSGCHIQPTPDILPKSGWQSFLGGKRQIMARYIAAKGLPSSLELSADEFAEVRAYFASEAPDEDDLAGPPRPIRVDAPGFEVVKRVPLEPELPTQGYLDIYVDSVRRTLVMTDVSKGELHEFDFAGSRIGSIPVGPGPVRISRISGQDLVVALLGGSQGGKIVRVERDRSGPGSRTSVLLEGLHRPIRGYGGRVGGVDGILVEEFGGDYDGGLTFWRGLTKPAAEPGNSLLKRAGIVESVVTDVDGNGTVDLLVLTSEESEQLLLFRDLESSVSQNPQLLFQGHPGYGFNGLALADMNGDGALDILVSNGDNYDIQTAPLKPYHGIRVFLQCESLKFSEPLFLPFHGVGDIATGDFDLDGDLDLVAISSFPDVRIRPYESAVLFEQVRPLEFVPRRIAPAAGSRWVVVKAADLDGDGDDDLIFGGAASQASGADKRWSESAGPDPLRMLILRNLRR